MHGGDRRSSGCGLAKQDSSSSAELIEHPVSKLDTLAGVAIKYGVEVADIKRMNGLVTDLQMFARKKLLIPRPGRHPPSNGECSTGGNGQRDSQSGHSDLDILEEYLPLKSKASMRRLSYPTLDGETERTVMFSKIASPSDRNNLPNFSPASSDPLPPARRKSKSFINGLFTENNDLTEQLLLPDSRDDSTISSGCVEPVSPPPELILKEDNSFGGFSGRAGANLALRPKSGIRSTFSVDAKSPTDTDMMLSNPNSVLMGVLSSVTDGLAAVRKSSPTLSLLSSDILSSIWPTSKWSLKSDLQSLTPVTTKKPIFDGLPTSRRSKTALD